MPGLLAWIGLGCLQWERVAAASEASVQPTVAAVLGIVSFSHWPVPHSSLTMCVVGASLQGETLLGAAVDTGVLQAGGLETGGVPIRPRRVAVGDERIGTGCDVVFEGSLTLAERQAVNRRLEGRAALTIGDAVPGCSEATMFCLRDRGAGVSFTTNLDMVARSGLRLNPRVLMLGRAPRGAGP